MDPADGIQQAVCGLRAAAALDLDALCDAEVDQLVQDVQLIGRLQGGLLARFARCWEQRGIWSGDGSKSPAARMACDGSTSQRTARTVLWRGRRLETTPTVAAAFAAGALSADQVDLLLAAASGREPLFARDEDLLVTQACRLRVAELSKMLQYWRHRADAELGVDGPPPGEPGPSLTLSPIDGGVVIEGELDPIGGQIVGNALDAIINDLGDTDAPLTQRRAAALVEMARRAMAMPADARKARIVANIVCGEESFTRLCELSNGTVIRPGQIVPYLGALDIRSILFDSATHAVATSSQRTFVGSLRGVIEVRDRHCQHPSGCDEPIDRCDADHIDPWARTHNTSQDNGRLLCRYHNRIEPQYARPPTSS